MNNMKTVWAPKTVPEELQPILAVQASWPMTAPQFREMMAQKVVDLFAQEQDQGRAALEMSEEHLPEMALIARTRLAREWPQALMQSDSMDAVMSKIRWDQEGPTTAIRQRQIQEILQDQSLASLIERL